MLPALEDAYHAHAQYATDCARARLSRHLDPPADARASGRRHDERVYRINTVPAIYSPVDCWGSGRRRAFAARITWKAASLPVTWGRRP
ncbi:hypothetical protein E4K10_44565 [Streptomyces sp. T1317-0309]|nr:hypothetical protein E4K10_44565 [Streptomyces sp. T1317-0309]